MRRGIAAGGIVLLVVACGLDVTGVQPADGGPPSDDGGVDRIVPPDGDAAVDDADAGIDSSSIDADAEAGPSCAQVCPDAGGSCSSGTCAITCPGASACDNDIVCPPGVPCTVTC